MYVCVFVCTYICLFVHIFVCLFVCPCRHGVGVAVHMEVQQRVSDVLLC